MKAGHILVVDDNKNVLIALRILLKSHFERVTLLTSPNQLLAEMREGTPDLILLDMNFVAGINNGNEGLFWLSEIRKADPDLPVVLFTSYADIDLAVRALKEGATDFVVKPWDNARLLATLLSAYSLRRSRQEVRSLKEKQDILKEEVSGEQAVFRPVSPLMKEVYQLVEKVAKTDANILLTGENGTGKEVLAKEIHRLSLRRSEVFIPVDMGAITESLFESELFGHVKGAFTDAKNDRAGKFEAANGGTLFLDEIGNLSYPLQAKLLTVLQSRTVVRVGGNKRIPVDIRLVSATNRDPAEMVRKGDFREDLLYRINTIRIEIPPLRSRKEDIPGLVRFFVKQYGSKYGKPDMEVSPEVLEKLSAYHWPGNIRELQHAIEKGVILSENSILRADDFYLEKPSPESLFQETVTLDEAEKKLIENALRRNRDNLSAVAAELGITRPTLYSKIKKYNL